MKQIKISDYSTIGQITAKILFSNLYREKEENLVLKSKSMHSPMRNSIQYVTVR